LKDYGFGVRLMTAAGQNTSSQAHPARLALRVTALVLLISTISFWTLKGAHPGWSQNQVPMKQTDEITGIEFVTYEQRFVPGVDFLAAGTGLAAGFFVVSLFFKRKSNNPT
jgi:hypothetical protein